MSRKNKSVYVCVCICVHVRLCNCCTYLSACGEKTGGWRAGGEGEGEEGAVGV